MTPECRKVKHPSIESAEKHRRHLVRCEQAAGEDRGRISIYPCPMCSTDSNPVYHVGHRRRKRKDLTL